MTVIEFLKTLLEESLGAEFTVRTGYGMTLEQFIAANVTDHNAAFLSWGGFSQGTDVRSFADVSEPFMIYLRVPDPVDIRETMSALYDAMQYELYTTPEGVEKKVSLDSAQAASYDNHSYLQISAEVA